MFFGCATFNGYTSKETKDSGQVSIYIETPDQTKTNISFDVTSIGVISVDNEKFEILNKIKNIDSSKLKGNQILLSEEYIKEGQYKALELNIKNPLKIELDKKTPLIITDSILIEYPFFIKKNINTSLFLIWDSDLSIIGKDIFKPHFNIKSTSPELTTLMLYVTNEGSNSVTVINRNTNNIVSNIIVGKKPRGIAVSQLKLKPRIFVANSGSNTISVIEPTKNIHEFEIPVRYGIEPEGITVAKISEDKELIIVTNFASDNISIIDGSTYEEIERINVGDGPIAVITDPDIETISSSRISNIEDLNLFRNHRNRYLNIYVANKNSKNVSIIKWAIYEKRALLVDNINVEWAPLSLSLDPQNLKIYVANYGSDNLSVIDIIQVIKGNISGSTITITNIGTTITGIQTAPEIDRIYLTKEFTGELISIRPLSEVFTKIKSPLTIAPIIDSIKVGNSPRSIAIDPEGRTIYVVNRGDNSLSVIDKTKNRVEKTIPVGNNPYGIAMFGF